MRQKTNNRFVLFLLICFVVSCSINSDEWAGYSRVDRIVVSRIPLDFSEIEPALEEMSNNSEIPGPGEG